MKKYDVIVVGSGPSGSVAGAYLAKGGMKTAIIEAGPVIGGTRYGGFERDGFRLDRHIHVLLWCLSLNNGRGNFPIAAKEVGAPLQFQVLPPNAAWINDPGIEVTWPYGACGAAVVALIRQQFPDRINDDNADEFARVIDYCINLDEETIWSTEFEEMRAIDWLKSVTDDPDVEAVLRSMTAANLCIRDEIALERASAQTLAGETIAGGFGGRHVCFMVDKAPAHHLCEVFCETAEKNGAEVFTNHPAKKYVYKDGKICGVVVADEKGNEEIWECDYVVNATNWPQIRGLVGDAITPMIDECVTSLSETDTIALDLHLGFDKKIIQTVGEQTMLYDDQGRYDGVIATFTNICPSLAPPGYQAVNYEYFFQKDQFETKSIDEWYDHMEQGIYKRWPETKDHVLWKETFIEKAPVHHGIYVCKHLPNESDIPGLYFAGDVTKGKGYFTERAVGSGATAAKLILTKENKVFW